MHRFLWPLLVVLVGGLTLASVPVAYTAQLHRDLLWATVRVCVLNAQTLGLAAPCASVDLGGSGRPGVAVLKVPGEATHVVVTPTADVAGLEDPRLQGADGAAVFAAALAARTLVVAAAGGPAALADVGLAVNSPMARSQDHLHIHVDCVAAATRAALDAGGPLGSEWRWLPGALEGRRYLARRAPEGLDLNPFAELAALLPAPRLIRQAGIAVISSDGGLALLADLRPGAMAELLLDHGCKGLPRRPN